MPFERFYQELKDQGIDFGTGVPCAVLKGLFDSFINDPEMTYVQPVREEDAIGIATGAYFAGRRPIVMMQNSGLANCVNALASLCIPYDIPLLLLASWRGCPEDVSEVPYHYAMGRSTKEIMNSLGIPVSLVPQVAPESVIRNSMEQSQSSSRPVVMLMRRGSLV